MDWKNPRAEVDYFRLKHTDPSGQEEEQSVRRSQEARTKHTIVGESGNWANSKLNTEVDAHFSVEYIQLKINLE